MATTLATPTTPSVNTVRTDWAAVARHLGPAFAARAAAHDANDTFVADNYTDLKQHKVFSAGVPTELGGGGASHAELCAMLRELAHACGSTALALAMHTHLLAATVWRWRQGQQVDSLLKRIVAEETVLISSGASDWLNSSGKELSGNKFYIHALAPRLALGRL
jgi:alkylation response protein AidB-like acyl-CoA dehydrogenase